MDSKTLSSWTRVTSVVTFEGLALWTVLAVECAEPCPVDVLPEVLGEVEHAAPHLVERVRRCPGPSLCHEQELAISYQTILLSVVQSCITNYHYRLTVQSPSSLVWPLARGWAGQCQPFHAPAVYSTCTS